MQNQSQSTDTKPNETLVDSLKAALAAAGIPLPHAMRPTPAEAEAASDLVTERAIAAAEEAEVVAEAAAVAARPDPEPSAPKPLKPGKVHAQLSTQSLEQYEAERRARDAADAASFFETQRTLAERGVRTGEPSAAAPPKPADLVGLDPVARDRFLANYADLIRGGFEHLVPEVHREATLDFIRRISPRR